MGDVYSENRYLELHQRTREKFPRFVVRLRRRSWLHPIFFVLAKITRQDYSSFTTTIFSTLYAADDWPERSSDRKYGTLRHELKHIRQFHSWPLGRRLWPINHILMSLAYVFLLPVRWTLRAKFEREGYTQTMLVDFELNGPFSDQKMESWARWLADTFGGSAYAWMWTRKKAYAWAMETMRKINAGEIRNDQDRVDEPRAA